MQKGKYNVKELQHAAIHIFSFIVETESVSVNNFYEILNSVMLPSPLCSDDYPAHPPLKAWPCCVNCIVLKCDELVVRASILMCCSEWGALQLLVDFGSVPNWLEGCTWLESVVRNHLARGEVLRRCEGVGRLLLRCPGEPVAMISPVSANKGSAGNFICYGSLLARMKFALLILIKYNY